MIHKSRKNILMFYNRKEPKKKWIKVGINGWLKSKYYYLKHKKFYENCWCEYIFWFIYINNFLL